MANFLKTNSETVIRFSDISKMTVNCAAGYLGIKNGNDPMEYIVSDNFELTIDDVIGAVECANRLPKASCTWDELWAFYLANYAPYKESRPTVTE